MIVKKDKFKNIFEGLKIAYGQYQKGDRNENGKQTGKAFIVRKNVSDDLWENHLQGKGAALGIIPINEDNLCKWGPSKISLRKRVFPSGRPKEKNITFNYKDPTWNAEHNFFRKLIQKNEKIYLNNDNFINNSIRKIQEKL